MQMAADRPMEHVLAGKATYSLLMMWSCLKAIPLFSAALFCVCGGVSTGLITFRCFAFGLFLQVVSERHVVSVGESCM